MTLSENTHTFLSRVTNSVENRGKKRERTRETKRKEGR
jgi:hypothetical protein